jgi:hypothetical protein
VANRKPPRTWTRAEDRHLILGIGAYGWSWFHEKLPARTRDEMKERARRLFGTGELTRGTYTLDSLTERTGYHRTQLLRARNAVGQKWRRTCPGGAYLISEEQMEELCSWLQHDYWQKSLQLYCCAWCGTDERPHHGGGLCHPCYQRGRRIARHWMLPMTISGKMALVEDLENCGLAAGHGWRTLEHARRKLSKGIMPKASTLRALGKLAQEIRNAAETGDN